MSIVIYDYSIKNILFLFSEKLFWCWSSFEMNFKTTKFVENEKIKINPE